MSESSNSIYLFLFFVKKFKSNHQVNLENIIKVMFYKEGLNQNLISYILFESSVSLGSGFHNPNYLEMKEIFQISGFYVPNYSFIRKSVPDNISRMRRRLVFKTGVIMYIQNNTYKSYFKNIYIYLYLL